MNGDGIRWREMTTFEPADLDEHGEPTNFVEVLHIGGERDGRYYALALPADASEEVRGLARRTVAAELGVNL